MADQIPAVCPLLTPDEMPALEAGCEKIARDKHAAHGKKGVINIAGWFAVLQAYGPEVLQLIATIIANRPQPAPPVAGK